jgi:hypothetical protein
MARLQKRPNQHMARIFGNLDPNPTERVRLRAEIDGLSDTESAHILGSFARVVEPLKMAALNAWRDVQTGWIQ